MVSILHGMKIPLFLQESDDVVITCYRGEAAQYAHATCDLDL